MWLVAGSHWGLSKLALSFGIATGIGGYFGSELVKACVASKECFDQTATEDSMTFASNGC